MRRTARSKPEEIASTDVRHRLHDMLGRVKQGGERLVIKQWKDRVAALVSMEDLHRLEQLDAGRTSAQEEHMHVIAFYNQAGGVGKSSNTRDIGYALAQRGKRVLLVDTDPQASLTRWLGLFERETPGERAHAELLASTVFNVIADEDAELPTPLRVHGMDVIPANSKLSAVDGMLYGDDNRLGRLREALRRHGGYDYVLIDVAPGRTAVALMAVAAADVLVVPVFGSKGIENMDNVVEVLRAARRFAPELRLGMFLLTGHSRNMKHDQDVEDTLRGAYRVLAPTSTPITFRKAVYNDARVAGQPIALFKPRDAAVAEIERVVDELVAVVETPGVRS